MCFCGFADETSVHCFLRCSRYTAQRTVLLSRISDIGTDVSVLPDEYLYHILIYGSNVYKSGSNELIGETITYVRNSGRFTKLEALG